MGICKAAVPVGFVGGPIGQTLEERKGAAAPRAGDFPRLFPTYFLLLLPVLELAGRNLLQEFPVG